MEFTQRLFGELNRAVLGPPDDGKIIVLSNSSEYKVHKEKTTSTEDVAASAAVNPASTASADANDAPAGKMIIVMIKVLIRRLGAMIAAEMAPTGLRPPRQEGAEAACFKEAWLFLLLFVRRSWDDNAEALTYFHTHRACFNLL
jgi:hypothetical protein